MGTLTLLELKEEVRAGLGRRTDLDTRLVRFLNLSQQRIARLHDFDEMEAISVSVLPFAGTFRDKYITLPSLREVYSFKVMQGTRTHRAIQKTQRWWNRNIPAPQELTRRDHPEYYTIWNRTVIIWPLASAADIPIEMWHTRWPLPFVDSEPTAVSQFEQKDEILVELSLVYAFNSLGKQKDAQTHWERARPLLVESISTDQTLPDLDISPSHGDDAYAERIPHEYWNDPFTKDIR